MFRRFGEKVLVSDGIRIGTGQAAPDGRGPVGECPGGLEGSAGLARHPGSGPRARGANGAGAAGRPNSESGRTTGTPFCV